MPWTCEEIWEIYVLLSQANLVIRRLCSFFPSVFHLYSVCTVLRFVGDVWSMYILPDACVSIRCLYVCLSVCRFHLRSALYRWTVYPLSVCSFVCLPFSPWYSCDICVMHYSPCKLTLWTSVWVNWEIHIPLLGLNRHVMSARCT